MANTKHPLIVKAERACAEALASTPEAYRKYIVMIPQSKNIGTKAQPKRLQVHLPYMAVDGRIALAIDEHRQAEGTINIGTTFQTVGDTILCQADVLSSLLGAASGHSEVFVGGSGVDKTNPYENAETSAIGRALGFLGYGLFGNGIASADEVEAAHEQEQPAPEEFSATVSGGGEWAEWASKAQINALLGLAERHGLTKRLDEAMLAKDLDIQRLPVGTYKRLLEKMHAAIQGDEGGPDYEAFEHQAKAEAQQARDANPEMIPTTRHGKPKPRTRTSPRCLGLMRPRHGVRSRTDGVSALYRMRGSLCDVAPRARGAVSALPCMRAPREGSVLSVVNGQIETFPTGC